MRISICWIRRQIAGVLVVLLAAPLAEGAAALPRQALNDQQAQTVPSTQNQPQVSDDPNQGGLSNTSQSGSEQPQSDAQKPVGTAAAPYEKTTGVAASRPAGAVIAPAKQRRARSILIRVGVIVGAAVAVGTVVALSRGSSSRPN